MRYSPSFWVIAAIVLWSYAHAASGPGREDGEAHETQGPEQQYQSLLREAESSEQRISYAGRFVRFAEEHSGHPLAFDALVWVARNRRSGEDAEKAIELLTRDYAQDPRFGSLCGALVAPHPANEKLLRAVLNKNPDRRVRGLACISLARKLDFESDIVSRLKENPDGVERARPHYSEDFMEWYLSRDPESMRAEAGELFVRAAGEFGITPIEIGKPAPEIQGKDARGELFRLSDYRGKVVLLTFTGNWCPPCRAMYPVEREIMKRFSDEPFTILSVNTDSEISTLVDSIESGEITWRCWWDGAPGGPISTRWGISTYPSLFVIGRDGNVRHRYNGVIEKGTLIKVVDPLLDKPKR